ncbi:MAG: hypothetical protein JW829_19310 [Pirellulales bacterium]|nr:hypothetical protein [Pirellulales bacterium]
MTRLHAFQSIFALLLVFLWPSVTDALSPALAEPGNRDDLPALVRTAANDFRPFSTKELATIRGSLVSNVAKLNDSLASCGPNGQAWKEYLLWNDLAEQLADDAVVDITKLGKVYRRYRANHPGLELPVFARVADSLLRYIDVSRMTRSRDGKKAYAQLIERLATDLEKYAAQPDQETVFDLGRRLGSLDGIGQSPRIVEAVRQRFGKPNLHVTVATALMDAGAMRSVQRTQYVTDCILGTSISGTATSDGTLHIKTVPCSDRAYVQLALAGTIHSNTVGENGPVCIYSTGETMFGLSKDLFFTDQGPQTRLAIASAQIATDIHCIQTKRGRIGSRIVERIAWRRAGKQQDLAEAIAAQHAEQQISAQFDRESVPMIAKIKNNYDKKFRLPLLRRNELPKRLDFATNHRSVEITALQANRAQLGAAIQPPPIREGYDLAVRVHESLPNNVASSFLSEYRLTDEWLKKKVIEWKGELPPELQDENEDPWSVTFAEEQPVTVHFADNGFTVTIRGKRFTSGTRRSNRLNITATYQFDRRPAGIVLVRKGAIEVLPPGFDVETGTLSAEDSALRGILIERLAKLFKPEIPTEGLELPGEMKKLGRLFAGEITSDQGWLAIGWNRGKKVPCEEKVPGTLCAENPSGKVTRILPAK